MEMERALMFKLNGEGVYLVARLLPYEPDDETLNLVVTTASECLAEEFDSVEAAVVFTQASVRVVEAERHAVFLSPGSLNQFQQYDGLPRLWHTEKKKWANYWLSFRNDICFGLNQIAGPATEYFELRRNELKKTLSVIRCNSLDEETDNGEKEARRILLPSVDPGSKH